MNKREIAIGYIRVSTKDQAENGASLQAQEDIIRRYAENNNMDLIKVISDGGFSAYKNTKREGYNELMSFIESNAIKHVVVYSLFRFMRNTRKTLEAIELMQKKKIAFHSYSEKIDTNTPMGVFFITVLAGLGQLESEQTGVRIKDTKRNSKGRLERYSSPIFGFNQSKDQQVKELEVNEQEMEVVRLIYAMNNKNASSHQIAKHLNGHGFKSKTGGAFHHSTVLNILNNEIYEEVLNDNNP